MELFSNKKNEDPPLHKGKANSGDLMSRIFVNYGPWLSGCAISATSYFVHQHYRKAVNVPNFTFSTFVVSNAFPTILGAMTHRKFVHERIVEGKNTCAACYELRSACVQVWMGLFVPVITSSLGSFITARRLGNNSIPPLNSRHLIDMFWRITEPAHKKFTYIIIFQLSFGLFLAYMEHASSRDSSAAA